MRTKRVSKLIDLITEVDIEAFLVIQEANVRYLTGFTGSGALFAVTPEHTFLVTDSMHEEQAHREAKGIEIVIKKGDAADEIAKLLSGCRKIGIEKSCSLSFFEKMRSAIPPRSELLGFENLVENMRMIKDKDELRLIGDAVSLAENALIRIRERLKPGASEREIASALLSCLVSSGSELPPFEPIIASGPNSSLPHASFGERTLEMSDVAVIDFGARISGYCCDMTRMVLLGQATERVTAALIAVRETLSETLSLLGPGVRARSVYFKAKEVLARHRLEEHFTHGLGHGIGLEVHEKPTLSRESEEVLEPGMVVTIEPGVYFAGEFGVRLEEMVLITGDGCEVLTANIPHTLEIN